MIWTVFWCCPGVDAATFTAALDRNSVPVGESVTLTLTYDGAGDGQPPQLPPLPNLTVASTGQSSQFSFVNGQRNTQITYTYQLTATQPGDVVIPAIPGRAGGVALSTQ
ncbi:MAG TPA: BatD family protein, partial [Candidatus Dormibacteraeota bacterium]|nr:BatD family protein [Candidatus Dormibacteraeota bacterium]